MRLVGVLSFHPSQAAALFEPSSRAQKNEGGSVGCKHQVSDVWLVIAYLFAQDGENAYLVGWLFMASSFVPHGDHIRANSSWTLQVRHFLR